MLVRGTTPQGEERLARAHRLRRAVYFLFFSFLLLVLVGIPLFVSRFSQIIPPDDPAFVRQLANADAVWTFRPAPLMEHLFGDAIVPLDLSTALSTLHQHGQVFVYHPTQANAGPQWIVVIPRRRPQRIFNGALQRLFHLEAELDLSPVYHIDRHRLLIASDAERMETFRQALESAGEVPKVEEASILRDGDLKDRMGGNYIARFRGEWGLLPRRLSRGITEFTEIDLPPETPIIVACNRTSDMIAITHPLDGPDEEYSFRKEFTLRAPSLYRHSDARPWMILRGLRLTGEIEPGAVPPPREMPEGRTY